MSTKVNRVETRLVNEDIVLGLVVHDGELLTQPRLGDPQLSGTWEFPGGKLQKDESHHEAVEREVREETDLQVRVGPLICALSHVYPDHSVSLYAYLCEVEGKSSPGGRSMWLSVDQYRGRPLPPANPPIVEALEWWLSKRRLDA